MTKTVMTFVYNSTAGIFLLRRPTQRDEASFVFVLCDITHNRILCYCTYNVACFLPEWI